jgi:hypothetical protein
MTNAMGHETIVDRDPGPVNRNGNISIDARHLTVIIVT